MRNFLSTKCWPGCTKTFKNACVMCAIFCKENFLLLAFCKLSSLGRSKRADVPHVYKW